MQQDHCHRIFDLYTPDLKQWGLPWLIGYYREFYENSMGFIPYSICWGSFDLVNSQFANWKTAIEFIQPVKMVIFHSCVSLPEGMG